LVDLKVYKHHGQLNALHDKLHSLPFPGLNADNLPYFVPICSVAKGRTLIHDWMYENRAIYYTEMAKIGTQIELADPHRVYINGPSKFNANDIIRPE
jgi:UDP-N-acetylglucosamine 1-carboxyvinyltransferase